jgi:hypothetical protein
MSTDVSEEHIAACKLAACFHYGILIGSFFDPEDEKNMFLRNVG